MNVLPPEPQRLYRFRLVFFEYYAIAPATAARAMPTTPPAALANSGKPTINEDRIIDIPLEVR